MNSTERSAVSTPSQAESSQACPELANSTRPPSGDEIVPPPLPPALTGSGMSSAARPPVERTARPAAEEQPHGPFFGLAAIIFYIAYFAFRWYGPSFLSKPPVVPQAPVSTSVPAETSSSQLTSAG